MREKLRLGEVNLDLEPIETSLYLCRPDKTTIASIKDVYDLRYNMRLGVVDELSFSIPAKIEREHQLISNPLIEEIKHRYLFKLIYNKRTQYFIFNERNKEFSDTESVSYRAFGLGYQLADKDIRGYEANSVETTNKEEDEDTGEEVFIPKTLSDILRDILSTSNWKVGYVDGYIDTKIRHHEIASSTVLQAVYDIAEKYNAMIVWDTKTLTINMYNPGSVGMNKGLRLREGKYLESFNLVDNSEEVVTRLLLYGREGLSIRRLTPTGSNYLEDFSWYMYPFKRGSDGSVIQSSDYMSDELVIALEDYYIHLESVQGRFDDILKELRDKQDEIQKNTQIMANLLSDLAIIEDELDVHNSAEVQHSTSGANSEESSQKRNEIIQRKDQKIKEIESQTDILEQKVKEEKAILEERDSLRESTDIGNHLTNQNLLELDQFIVEKEFVDDSIVDEEDLLEVGIEAFEKYREPSINLNMSITNFLSHVESQNDHDKLGLGDTVSVESKRLGVDIKAKITEIEFDFDKDDIALTIANERDISDSDSRFLDMIYSANNTSNIVNNNKFKWELIEETNSVVSQILNSEWDAIKRRIVAGYEQNVVISERGIIIKSPEDPMNWLVAQNGVLAITNDGGNSWKHAITPNGIIGERIVGRLLMGASLIIEDEDGIIKMTGSEMSIYDPEGREKVILGKYGKNSDNYGLLIKNGGIRIENGLPESEIDHDATDKWNSAEKNANEYTDDKDSHIRKDLGMTAPLPTSIKMDSSGITAYTQESDKYARLDYRGLYIQGGALDIRTGTENNRGVVIDGDGISGYDKDGKRAFHLDTEGNLSARTGELINRIDEKVGNAEKRVDTKLEVLEGEISASITTSKQYTNSQIKDVEESISSNFTVLEGKISSSINTSKKYTDDEIGLVEKNISSSLDVMEGKISAKASSSEVTALGSRINNVEWDLDAVEGQISQKVSKSDFTGETMLSEISQTASNIKIKAKNIDLDGITRTSNTLQIGSSESQQRITFPNRWGEEAWIEADVGVYGSRLDIVAADINLLAEDHVTIGNHHNTRIAANGIWDFSSATVDGLNAKAVLG